MLLTSKIENTLNKYNNEIYESEPVPYGDEFVKPIDESICNILDFIEEAIRDFKKLYGEEPYNILPIIEQLNNILNKIINENNIQQKTELIKQLYKIYNENRKLIYKILFKILIDRDGTFNYLDESIKLLKSYQKDIQ